MINLFNSYCKNFVGYSFWKILPGHNAIVVIFFTNFELFFESGDQPIDIFGILHSSVYTFFEKACIIELNADVET